MKHRYLSYKIMDAIPAYGGQVDISTRYIRSIGQNDAANVVSIVIQSHWGTHVDAPRHFFQHGKKITDYSVEQLIFSKPYVIPLSLSVSEIFSSQDILHDVPPDTDIILFKSGWGSRRNTPEYCINNPGIHPDICLFLRTNFPSLKAIGIDWISISSFRHRDIGRQSHRVLLDPDINDNALLIIEDMDLSEQLESLQKLFIVPLRVDSFDSSPCTVIGVFHD